MKATTKRLVEAKAQPVDKMKLARRTFTLDFKADVVRHRQSRSRSNQNQRCAALALPGGHECGASSLRQCAAQMVARTAVRRLVPLMAKPNWQVFVV